MAISLVNIFQQIQRPLNRKILDEVHLEYLLQVFITWTSKHPCQISCTFCSIDLMPDIEHVSTLMYLTYSFQGHLACRHINTLSMDKMESLYWKSQQKRYAPWSYHTGLGIFLAAYPYSTHLQLHWGQTKISHQSMATQQYILLWIVWISKLFSVFLMFVTIIGLQNTFTVDAVSNSTQFLIWSSWCWLKSIATAISQTFSLPLAGH
jgi:hypothetical protein